MANFTISMLLERETKGAVRYQEVDENGDVAPLEKARIGTLYIRKTALNGSVPGAIAVNVKHA